jgi:Flp pilus assembly protein TadG
MRRLRNTQRKERGQALVEFALLAPLLVILIFGFVDITRLYNAWITVQGAAREGARYGVTGRSDCPAAADDRLVCIKYSAAERTKNLTNSSTNVAVTVRSWAYPAYADPPAEGNPGKQCDALEVKVEYDFKPSTPLANSLLGAVHMTGKERLVNEPYGPCGT